MFIFILFRIITPRSRPDCCPRRAGWSMPGKTENCTRFSKTSCCLFAFIFYRIMYKNLHLVGMLFLSFCLGSVALFPQLICTLHLKTLCNICIFKLNTRTRRRRSRRQRDKASCASSPFRAKTVELCAPRPRKKTLPKPTKTRNRFDKKVSVKVRCDL